MGDWLNSASDKLSTSSSELPCAEVATPRSNAADLSRKELDRAMRRATYLSPPDNALGHLAISVSSKLVLLTAAASNSADKTSLVSSQVTG